MKITTRLLFLGSVCPLLGIWPAEARPAHLNVRSEIAAIENGLRPAIEIAGQPGKRWTIAERMQHWGVPGVSIAMFRDGKIVWAKGYGVLQAGRPDKVDTETMFSVGSVSKVSTAAVSLRMVAAGELDLDRDVNAYLRRWQVPNNAYTAHRSVTLRGLMSHSAGMNVHGFPDFQPEKAYPSVIDTLEGRAPAITEPVRVGYTPGSHWRYAGGGTTVEQLVIEDAAGISFPDAARRYLFTPLGLKRSTYQNPLPANLTNVAKAHGPDGRPRALPRGYETMAEMGASGWWTTPSDCATLMIALIDAYRGKPDAFLPPALTRQMMTEVGVSPYGLGPKLSGQGMDRIFYHNGSNDSYKAWVEGHLYTGDGLVIFTNGENGEALYKEMRRAVAAVEGWNKGAAVLLPEKLEPSGDLSDHAGRYVVRQTGALANLRSIDFSLDVTGIEIVDKPDGLYATYTGSFGKSDAERLVPQGGEAFIKGDDAAEQIVFVHDYAGRVSGIMVQYDGYSFEADLTN